MHEQAIAEGGATGPTFRPEGMDCGFAVIAVAGRKKSKDEDVVILAQKVCYSPHAERELNMRLFADSAADLCLEAIYIADPSLVAEVQLSQEKSAKNTNKQNGEMEVVFFLDRSSHIRDNAAIMQDMFQRMDAKHVILRGTGEVLFAKSTELALPTLQDMLEDEALVSLLETDDSSKEDVLEKRTFLGRLGAQQTPVFSIVLPKNTVYDNKSYQNCYFANTRARAPLLDTIHNELALTATAYANWKDTHHFCSMSGSPLEYIHGGTCAMSTGSSSERTHLHWPRQDPSIIVLVNNPSRTHALLARSPRHPPYLYTALAGFVEAGETFESAVVREVHEEVGVHIDRETISYIASQPWPFPRSTMIGMHARTHEDFAPIQIDPNEIVDAKWYDKETVYQASRHTDEIGAVLEQQVVNDKKAKGEWNGQLLIPSKGVLARKLIDHWLDGH